MTSNPSIAEQADILAPDRDIPIGDEIITVREFSYFQGLKLAPIAADLLDDFRKLVDTGPDLSLESIENLFGRHADVVIRLVSASINKPVSWIDKNVNDTDGQSLTMLFWTVNKDFFLRRLITRKMGAALSQKSEKSPASPKSSAPSSPAACRWPTAAA